jgi:competence protein ComGC
VMIVLMIMMMIIIMIMLNVPVNPWYLSGSGSNDFVSMFHSLTYTDSSPCGINRTLCDQ